MHAHQRPAALEFFAMQFKLELSAFEARDGVTHRRPQAAVPDDDIACSVLFGWNLAFKVGVGKRMVFHMHAHALDSRVETGPLGNSPTFQRALQFQPEVIVQIACCMLLDDKCQRRV